MKKCGFMYKKSDTPGAHVVSGHWTFADVEVKRGIRDHCKIYADRRRILRCGICGDIETTRFRTDGAIDQAMHCNEDLHNAYYDLFPDGPVSDEVWEESSEFALSYIHEDVRPMLYYGDDERAQRDARNKKRCVR